MPWGTILNILLKFVTIGLDARGASIDSKKRFLEFIDSIENEGIANVKLNEQDRSQLEELKRKRNADT